MFEKKQILTEIVFFINLFIIIIPTFIIKPKTHRNE